MKAHILTPKGVLFEGEVEGVQMPGIQGGFEVRADHSPFVSLLDIGRLVVKITGKPDLVFAVSGGFTEVKDNTIVVMAEQAIAANQINIKEESSRKEQLQLELAEYRIFTDEHKRTRKELRKVVNRLKIAQ